MEKLLRGSYSRLYAVCKRMTGNDTDAADATQEAMIGIVKGLPRFDGRSRFSTWTYRIAVNASIDEVRRRTRRRADSLDELSDSASLASLASIAPIGSSSAGAVTNMESVADAVDVDRALLTLPADFRAAVVLRDLCGLDYAEIAEVLDLPAGTVRSRIARGRGLLAQRLAPTADDR